MTTTSAVQTEVSEINYAPASAGRKVAPSYLRHSIAFAFENCEVLLAIPSYRKALGENLADRFDALVEAWRTWHNDDREVPARPCENMEDFRQRLILKMGMERDLLPREVGSPVAFALQAYTRRGNKQGAADAASLKALALIDRASGHGKTSELNRWSRIESARAFLVGPEAELRPILEDVVEETPAKPAKTEAKRIPRGQWAKHLEAELPGVFLIDTAVYDSLANLAVDQSQYGNLYELVVLSTGGLYLAPDRKYQKDKKITLRSPNGSERTVSSDAAGIVASLFAFSHLSFGRGGQVAGGAYRKLYAYALNHAEIGDIAALLD
jgi:hypothetical protein